MKRVPMGFRIETCTNTCVCVGMCARRVLLPNGSPPTTTTMTRKTTTVTMAKLDQSDCVCKEAAEYSEPVVVAAVVAGVVVVFVHDCSVATTAGPRRAASSRTAVVAPRGWDSNWSESPRPCRPLPPRRLAATFVDDARKGRDESP
jgi:hypothetical protein